MRCSTDKLISYIDNTLSEEKAREVEEHLKKCEVCREAYNSFKIIEAFEEEQEVMPVDITSRVMNAIDKDKYSNKKYRYFNKFMANRISIYRGVAVAGFALIFIGCVWVAKEMDLFNGIGSTAELQQTNEKVILENNSENKEFPERYTSEMAKANGDVVNGLKETVNINKLDRFIKNTESKIKDNVRIVSYTDEGDAILTDLMYEGRDIIAIADYTRDKFSAPENRTKTQYKISKILKVSESEDIIYKAITDEGVELFLARVTKK